MGRTSVHGTRALQGLPGLHPQFCLKKGSHSPTQAEGLNQHCRLELPAVLGMFEISALPTVSALPTRGSGEQRYGLCNRVDLCLI